MSGGTKGRAKSAGRERTCDRVLGLDEGLCEKRGKKDIRQKS